MIAFYMGGLVTSLSTGTLVLALLDSGGERTGSMRAAPHSAASIAAGLVALVFAWLMASARGNMMLGRVRSRHSQRRRTSKQPEGPSWAERRLGRASCKIAFLVGAVINLPGPFYLLALGKIAHGDYSTFQRIGLVLLFNAIMFLLLEVPLVGYFLRPEATAKRVTSVSRWLNANGLRITGWLVGLFGASLLARGIEAVAS